MAKKNKEKDISAMSEDERVEFFRGEQLEYENFKGGADAAYIVALAKPLIEMGFSSDNVVTLIVNKMSFDLSENLKSAEVEIARINSGKSFDEEESEEL